MLRAKTKRLEICIDINIEINEVDHYTWVFTSRIFRLALEITFLLNKYFFLQMAYELLSQSRKLKAGVPNKSGGRGVENFLKKISGRTLVQEPRVLIKTFNH